MKVGINGAIVDASSTARSGERKGDSEGEGTVDVAVLPGGCSIIIKYANSAARRSARARLKSICAPSIET